MTAKKQVRDTIRRLRPTGLDFIVRAKLAKLCRKVGYPALLCYAESLPEGVIVTRDYREVYDLLGNLESVLATSTVYGPKGSVLFE